MTPSLARILALAALLAPVRAGAAPANPPPPTPANAPITFGSEVEMVVVDAVAVDRKGNSVLGLRREDFTVAEDGVPQPIESFEAVQVAPLPPGKVRRRPPIATNTTAETRTARFFAVVFDDMHMSPFQAHRGRTAVAEFLQGGVREGDRVLLMPTSGGAWWSARMESGREELIGVLKRFEGRRVGELAGRDRITDYESLRIIDGYEPQIVANVQRRLESAGMTYLLEQDKDKRMPGSINPYIEKRARQTYDEAVLRNRLALDAIKRVLDALATAKGRKSLILVSEGFVLDPQLGEFRDVISAARRANTAIYFLDTRGLDAGLSSLSAEFNDAGLTRDVTPLFADVARESEGAEMLASETGGFSVKNTSDLASGIRRISDESRGYYLLGYTPTASPQDGRFHRINVQVNRKGLTVRARRGYFAASAGQATKPPPAEGEPDADMQRVLDAPFDLDAIPLRLTAYTFDETLIGRAKVYLAADVDIRNLVFEEREGRLVDSIDVLLFISHLETGEVFSYSEKVEMRLRPQTLAKTNWYPLMREFDLGAGSYQVRLVVRDQNAAKFGTVTHAFDLPDLGQLRVSTPVLSDTVKPSDEDPNVPQPVLLARRSFAARGLLYCQIEVFNAQRNSETGKREVTCAHRLIGSGGRIVSQSEPTPIQLSPKGGVSRLIGLSLEGLDPGEYEVAMDVVDTVANKTIEIREPFTVLPATASPGAN